MILPALVVVGGGGRGWARQGICEARLWQQLSSSSSLRAQQHPWGRLSSVQSWSSSTTTSRSVGAVLSATLHTLSSSSSCTTNAAQSSPRWAEIIISNHTQQQRRRPWIILGPQQQQQLCTFSSATTQPKTAPNFGESGRPEEDDSLSSISSSSTRGTWDDIWNARFQELQAYKAQHHHCNVPVNDDENHSLGLWVDRQRTLFRNGELSRARQKRLQDIGFVWRIFEESWEGFYQQLQDYHQHHQDCRVPLRYETNPSLGKWVQRQRKLYADGKLPQDRQDKLHRLNFCWSELDARWDEKLHEFNDYVRIHGRWPTTRTAPTLYSWMRTQRMLLQRVDNDHNQNPTTTTTTKTATTTTTTTVVADNKTTTSTRSPLTPERIQWRIQKLTEAGFPF
eukprot:CAMPEP_0168736718 /NCGR_PEP_ID=MMETSP0724-20121128/10006_1 /TAXON_ID=265536 /ORGANISM="Amphiprora sp., Strain CCMP467" /LENGTH=394 /DNA_ID=CAMNT_0008783927 /DNA_START=46 /DNA_END=1227 /DNA_ORIENTATION=-